MKNYQQINFFNKKSSQLLFFLIPIIILVLLSIGVLIACGWYIIDYQIAKELAKGLNFELGK